jgi:hypothetical protein
MAHIQDIERALSDGSTVYCGKCHQACEVEARDYGYGAHEYGGSFGVHSDVSLQSDCCDSENLLLESELPEAEELTVAAHESEGNCGWTEPFEKFARCKALIGGKA